MWTSRYTTLFGKLDTEFLRKNYPKALGLELTTSCAFRCVHCPKGSARYDRPQGVMGEQTLDIVLEQVKDLDLREVSLSNDGDVSCLPNSTFLKYLRNIDKGLFPDIKLTVISNLAGFTFDAMSMIASLQRPIKTVIDLYGARPETVTKVTGFPHPEELVEKAEFFLEVLKSRKHRTEVYVQAFTNELSPEEQKEFQDKWTNFIPGLNVILNKLYAYPGLDLSTVGVSPVPKNFRRYPCSHPFVSWNVNYDGKVPMCCLAYGHGIVGDIQDQHLEEIWSGEQMNEVRRRLLANELDGTFCANCDQWYYAPQFFFPWSQFGKALRERRIKKDMLRSPKS